MFLVYRLVYNTFASVCNEMKIHACMVRCMAINIKRIINIKEPS